jgi:uncharacterized protein YfbU (UPF0304 family)
MAQLNVRLDDHTRDSFDALARARGLSASDLIRGLIDRELGRDVGPDRFSGDAAPRSLSATERRALVLHHEVLAVLTADSEEEHGGSESQYHRQMIEVLNAGFTAEYSDMFAAIQPELPPRECQLVNDILQMFGILERSMKELNEEERAGIGEHAEDVLRFRGFDFNASREARLASYARYLISTDRWQEMAEHFDAEHERGNSHLPLLASYQRMLAVWEPIWRRKLRSFSPDAYLYTPAELREVYAAGPYPNDD